jgi:3',5'-cyclic AMP phosphodiesterase CpdA
VVVLDADCDIVKGGCGADSPQLRWLRDDLAASGARCTLGLWHQPRFSSGQHGDDPAVGAFWDALYAAGADLVLNGHDHDYERLAPQDPSGNVDAARGITEIVVGTGGGELRDFKSIERDSVARVSGTYGVLALTLSDGGWSYRFVGTTPGFTDQGTGACH